MKKSRFSLVIVSIFLIVSVLVNLTGCSKQSEPENLMSGVYTHLVEPMNHEQMQSYHISLKDYSLRILKKCQTPGSNAVISPISVLYALGMVANGADGQTRQQIENLFGMSVEEMNQYLYTYLEWATAPSKNHKMWQGVAQKVLLANSIWFDKEKAFVPNKDFLQTNANYYSAGVYSIPFDENAPDVINEWSKEKTENQIPAPVEKLSEEAVMVLMNALLFDYQWQDFYWDEDVKEGDFTMEDGTKQKAEFMYSKESRYMENDMLTGFIKPFVFSRYYFIGLLPKEGYTVEQCMNELDAIGFDLMYSENRSAEVDVSIPKFKTGFNVSMKDVLCQLGLTDAFTAGDANFTKMGDLQKGELYISEILHNVTFELDEKGVVAGATTTVEATAVGGADERDEHKIVHLDHPFIYMVYDWYHGVPVFIGTMMDIEG